MRYFWRILISGVSLAFIFVNVYVASLPTKKVITHSTVFKQQHTQALLSQLSSFKNWESANFDSSISLNVIIDRYEPLHNVLSVGYENDKEVFSLQNQSLNDTLVLQHVYGLRGNKATSLQWVAKKNKLHLTITQQLSTKQKLINLLGVVRFKDAFFENNYIRLMPLYVPVSKKEQVPPKQNTTSNPPNTIHLPKQN